MRALATRFSALLLLGFALVPFVQAQSDLEQGMAYVQQDAYDEAIPLLERAVKAEPDNADAHYWLGAAYGIKAQNSGMLRQARLAPKIRKQFERAVDLDPRHLEAREGLMEYYLQAPSIAGGDKNKALEQAQAIAGINQERGFFALIRAHSAREEWDQVEGVYQQGIAETGNVNLQVELGYFYQRRERFADAMTTFEAILEAQPANLTALYQVGRTAALSGDFLERGAEALEAYVQQETGPRQPGHDSAYHRLGMVYAHQGRTDDARAAYEQALAINPDNEAAQEAMRKLK
ncbi:MAG: tetratricopeptide repeat protein [Bacteroidota bacterium]